LGRGPLCDPADWQTERIADLVETRARFEGLLAAMCHRSADLDRLPDAADGQPICCIQPASGGGYWPAGAMVLLALRTDS